MEGYAGPEMTSMPRLELTCALSSNPRTHAILDGRIRPDGIDLTCTSLHGSEIFFRQLKYKEFDVSEMSLASHTISTDVGMRDWVMIPVFTTRMFFHTGIIVRNDRGIEAPADLKGKVVGVPEFQQTAVIWTRAVLRNEFGVEGTMMRWYMERNPDQSHGGAMGFSPPPGIELSYTPKDSDNGRMLLDGKLDALLHWLPTQNLVDRSSVDVLKEPGVRLLFDPVKESHRYFAKTGLFPINHGLVVRRSVYEEHPWVIASLFQAFARAKKQLEEQTRAGAAPYLVTGMLPASTESILDHDVAPYGLESSRRVLETITAALLADKLTKRQIGLEEIFAAEALTL
jgi:4,5-dihydroxyphthalate decarboxylase